MYRNFYKDKHPMLDFNEVKIDHEALGEFHKIRQNYTL